jgi:hypothetical protein
MSNPDWTQAPTEATHYDTYADCFCDVNGWWRMERYQLLKNQNEWGTSRYVPRPTEPVQSDWVDGWPPVGWQGEVSWQSKADWFACMVIPDGSVVVQGSAGTWNVVSDLKEYDYEFREVQSEQDAERADLEDFIEKAISAGLKPKGIASGIIEKGYRLVKD